jgi:hypothetical protein
MSVPYNWMPSPAGLSRGQSQAMINSAVGGAQPAVLFPLPMVGAGVAAWPAVNRGIFVNLRFDRATAVNGIGVPIGAASGNLRVALFSSDGTTLTRLQQSASTPAAGANVFQAITLTTQPVVPFVDYYAFAVADNTTLTVLRLAVSSAFFTLEGNLAFVLDTVFAAIPANPTIAGMAAGASTIPVLSVRTTG